MPEWAYPGKCNRCGSGLVQIGAWDDLGYPVCEDRACRKASFEETLERVRRGQGNR